jgi:hypothetical protein
MDNTKKICKNRFAKKMLGVLPVPVYQKYIFPLLDGWNRCQWMLTCKKARQLILALPCTQEMLSLRMVFCENTQDVHRAVAVFRNKPEARYVNFEQVFSAIRKEMFRRTGEDVELMKNMFELRGDALCYIYQEPYCFVRCDEYHRADRFLTMARRLERLWPDMFFVQLLVIPWGKPVCLYHEDHDDLSCCLGHVHRGYVALLRIKLPDEMCKYDRIPSVSTPYMRNAAEEEDAEVFEMSERVRELKRIRLERAVVFTDECGDDCRTKKFKKKK